ncbi:hypothetical protein KVP10_15035 [Candidimonas humi]|uniref:Cytochrome c oxidase assembly factor CtaG n=1 Tax=Candidimonas humi TaxID=683355 RepID=A0ABV8P0W2_9BURK|nr:hypothetical protein [Candidimonas humi]MBV6306206.1 hypothetical protein [Candidimonas humi]
MSGRTTAIGAAWRRPALASAGLLLLALLFLGPLTSSMALHMFVHIPLILCAGMCTNHALAGRPDGCQGWLLRSWRRFDEFGVPGLLLASLAGAYWMIPKALDQVQAYWWAQAMKFFVLFVLGMILLDSLRRANMVVKLFFLGGFCWMAAVVGLLYQNDTTRLCNFYLAGDQVIAGRGLVALSILLPLACLARYWRWLFDGPSDEKRPSSPRADKRRRT